MGGLAGKEPTPRTRSPSCGTGAEVRHAQRWWLERAARECVDLAMNDTFHVDVLEEVYSKSLTPYLERIRQVKREEIRARLIEIELLDRELARRKP